MVIIGATIILWCHKYGVLQYINIVCNISGAIYRYSKTQH